MKQYIYDASLNSDDAPAKVLKLVGTNKRVLEVGCSSGSQTRVLSRELRCTVIGVEIDKEAAKHAERYCAGVIAENFETLDVARAFQGEWFDVVIFADVLEHLRDPPAALKKARSLLAPAGYLLASIPNVAHAAITLELAGGRFQYRKNGLLDDTHIRFFTLDSLLALFSDSGYAISFLDRVRRQPEETEFSIDTSSPENRVLFGEIKRYNPEYDTYQFIVKAVALARQNGAAPQEAIPSATKTEGLVELLAEKQKLINSLQSKLDWITRQRSYRFATAIKRFLRPSR